MIRRDVPHRTLVRSVVTAVLATLLLSVAHTSGADEPEYYEGLPEQTFGAWASASQGGMSYAVRARQWFRSPMGISVVEQYFGQDTGGEADGDGWHRVEAYVVSPEGAPANYGYLEPMTVRSVGFGLMPVEATVQVSQMRKDGLPVPISMKLRTDITKRQPEPNGGFITDEHHPVNVITTSFNVQILSVRVDGIDIGLTGDCRTVEPAPAVLRTPAYTIYDTANNPERTWYRTHDPSTYWSPLYGGQMAGEMTIPPFTGCTTAAGDDLSDLLTLSASGPDNPISARNGWPCNFINDNQPGPPPPGASNPRISIQYGGRNQYGEGCPGIKPFEYPARDDAD